MVGNADEAEARLREACEILDAHGDRGGLCYARARLAYVVAPWNPEEAERLCAASDFLNLHAVTLEDLAAACGAAGDREGERAALVRALDLYEAKGNALASARIRPAIA